MYTQLHRFAQAEQFIAEIRVAAECVAMASQSPPVHPTTMSILRVIRTFGSLRYAQLRKIVKCADTTLKRQLSDLHSKSGLISKHKIDRETHYQLTAVGHKLLEQIQEEATVISHRMVSSAQLQGLI